jgi:adenine phosphoribosyltransferase
MAELKALCRNVPDFPKKGILFRDITTLIREGDRFREVIDTIGARYEGKGVDVVVGVESRGFIIGGALAYKLGAGFVPVRKKGKLPWRTYQATYDLEYGTDTLEVHQDAVGPGQKVLIIDDLIATGGTACAVIELVEKLKGEIIEVAFLIELTDLKGRDKVQAKNYPVYSLLQF